MVVLILLSSFKVYAESAYLYVFLHDDNTNGERFRTEFPSMEMCLAALDHSKSPNQSSTAGDYEVAVVMWCGGENFSRHDSGTWWIADKKASSTTAITNK